MRFSCWTVLYGTHQVGGESRKGTVVEAAIALMFRRHSWHKLPTTTLVTAFVWWLVPRCYMILLAWPACSLWAMSLPFIDETCLMNCYQRMHSECYTILAKRKVVFPQTCRCVSLEKTLIWVRNSIWFPLFIAPPNCLRQECSAIIYVDTLPFSRHPAMHSWLPRADESNLL